MKEEILISIDDDGSIDFETRGFKGKKCVEELEQFMDELLITEFKLTGEYYEGGDSKVRTSRSIERRSL